MADSSENEAKAGSFDKTAQEFCHTLRLYQSRKTMTQAKYWQEEEEVKRGDDSSRKSCSYFLSRGELSGEKGWKEFPSLVAPTNKRGLVRKSRLLIAFVLSWKITEKFSVCVCMYVCVCVCAKVEKFCPTTFLSFNKNVVRKVVIISVKASKLIAFQYELFIMTWYLKKFMFLARNGKENEWMMICQEFPCRLATRHVRDRWKIEGFVWLVNKFLSFHLHETLW